MIDQSSQRFIHKIVYSRNPRQCIDIYRLQRTRECQNISLKIHPKRRKFKTQILNQGHNLYNSIPSELRNLDPKQYKNKIKKINMDKMK